MYIKFYGLEQPPFSIAPDPRYLYMSERHRDALAHLVYGLGGDGGFVLLTGEVGAGKTTVCRCFLEQIPPNCNLAYIFNPKLTVIELLQSICDEFGVAMPQREPGTATVKDYLDPLNKFLLEAHAAGRSSILFIDEAQNLAPEVLEQLRLLTNLETTERKLLQIVLIGQPELREMLARPELEQLSQRVIARFHLGALSEAETTDYISHRMAVAGLRGPMPFDAKAMERIYRWSRGVPRRINLLCDRALLGGYVEGKQRIDNVVVDRAAREVFGDPVRVSRSVAATPGARWPLPAAAKAWALRIGALPGWALALGGLVLIAAAGSWGYRQGASQAAAPPALAPTPDKKAEKAATPPAPPAPATKPDARTVAAPASAASGSAVTTLPSPIATEDLAWAQLAPAWGLSLTADNPCAAAARVNVLCFRSNNSTLSFLRRLNRPGILTLQDPPRPPTYVLLTGLSRHEALIAIDAGHYRVALTALMPYWRGEFATYWRAPAGYRTPLSDGHSGPAVDWLSQQLAAWSGEPAPPAGQIYGPSLRLRVRTFQSEQGLTHDGYAGPTTFMMLNRVRGIDEPRLLGGP